MDISQSNYSENSFKDLFHNPIESSLISSIIPVFDNVHGLFHGIAIMLKDGSHFLTIVGINQRKERIDLGVNGISKQLVDKILPSTPNGTSLHGFIIRLTSGDSIYLTIGKLVKEH